MSAGITQCPHCRTAFRVTAAQLEAAAGAVRCGSCLHIFNAVSAAPAATVHTTPLPHRAPPVSLEPVHEQLALDDDTATDDSLDQGLDDQLDGYRRFDAGNAQPEWLVGEHADRSGHSQSFLDLEDWEEEPRSIFSDIGKLEAELENDEQWAHELLRELEEEDGPSEDGDSPAAPEPETAESTTADFPEPEPEPEFEPAAIDSDPDAAGQDQTHPDANTIEVPPPLRAEREDAAERRRLLELEPEPLELPRRQSPARPRRQGLYIALSLVAAVTLAAQYLFFHFDRLALGPQREVLAGLCHWLDCELPRRSAPELIRTGNLMVRSHPDHPRALAVDAIITNRAPFAQAWPVLRLTFSDLNGTAIATRGFRPEEYLAGELTGAAEIPSRRPVHVALELVDPGPRAVNYELYLEPAPASGSAPSR